MHAEKFSPYFNNSIFRNGVLRMIKRNRTRQALLVIAAMAAGLGSRKIAGLLPDFVNAYLGDAFCTSRSEQKTESEENHQGPNLPLLFLSMTVAAKKR